MSDDLRRIVLADPTIPEPVRRALERGAELQEIRLDLRGQWWHAGARIEHVRIAELFSRSVNLTPGRTFVLEIGHFTYPILVEDTPLFVVGVQIDEALGEVRARLSDGTRETLDLATLQLVEPERLLVSVKDGRVRARFQRDPYHQLLDHAHDGPDGPELVIGPRSFSLANS